MDPNQQPPKPAQPAAPAASTTPATPASAQTTAPNQPIQQVPQKKGYGKRPIWQWILLYVVLAGIIYAAIYFFFLSGGAPSVPGY